MSCSCFEGWQWLPGRDTAKLIAVLGLGTRLLMGSVSKPMVCYGPSSWSFPIPTPCHDVDFLVHQNHCELIMHKAPLNFQVWKLLIIKETEREHQRSGKRMGKGWSWEVTGVSRKGSFKEEKAGKSVKCHREDGQDKDSPCPWGRTFRRARFTWGSISRHGRGSQRLSG